MGERSIAGFAGSLACVVLALATLPSVGFGQTGGLVAPPRNTSDITGILDQQKPDPSRVAKARADADASPPAGRNAGTLGEFYFGRCQARAATGRHREAIADCEKAVSLGGDYLHGVSRYQQLLSNQYRAIGEFRKSIEIDQQMARKFEEIERGKGRFFGINLRIAISYLNMGDLKQAERYVKNNQALLQESKSWRNPAAAMSRTAWESGVENGNARLFEARGRNREAELAYTRSAALLRDALVKSASWANPPPKGTMESTIDHLTAFAGRAKMKQGRLSEAEADIRRALLSRLKSVGKYHGETAFIVLTLAQVVSEQARYTEAERLSRTAVDIYRSLEYPADSPPLVSALNHLAGNLFAQTRWDEAGEIFATLDEATNTWDPARRDGIRLSWARIFTLYNTRKVPAGLELAQANAQRAKERFGVQHFNYAMAQAILGAGYVFARRDGEAAQVFKAAMPVLLVDSSHNDEDDATSAVAFDQRLSNVVEAYLTLLARTPDADGTVAAESFRLGELIRGRSVEKALSASSARAAARDPRLAEVVRKEQDLGKEIEAELGNLNNMLALPPEERDDKAVRELQAAVDKLRAARSAARRDVQKRFPAYADLVAPKPATIDEVRAALKEDEAFLSFYFGRRGSFVWAVPKQGPVAFARVQGNWKRFDQKVQRLREALDPKAATIDDIPPFDTALAYELYSSLLKPVEAGWKPAKNLIVVTHGALGLLPLSLLPTAPAESRPDAEQAFAGYRKVAWLARSHAVTVVPSAAALRTLRQLPAGPATREQLIGFGDPLFNAEQAAEAAAAVNDDLAEAATRGVPLRRRASPQTRGVDSAELGLLPRLPDTAEELKSIALALEADPAKVLHLGKDANEQAVRSIGLAKYRIIVFATHGLVPGDLNGLSQPALALSAPDVAGVPGDGLLTMEEIPALKLDADWVVLSACNTGAGAGAGAEAVSGLGRAFFYAGTRAILITNWPVHSASARELVSDLFRRQAADTGLTRAEALRQAMISVLDGPGFTDPAGKTVFTYAHPLFWAPYSIIGDGGGAMRKAAAR
jgi:CHAT domain-containing protein